MLDVHAPEAESVHYFSQGVVIVEKLDGAHYVKQDLSASAHP